MLKSGSYLWFLQQYENMNWKTTNRVSVHTLPRGIFMSAPLGTSVKWPRKKINWQVIMLRSMLWCNPEVAGSIIFVFVVSKGFFIKWITWVSISHFRFVGLRFTVVTRIDGKFTLEVFWSSKSSVTISKVTIKVKSSSIVVTTLKAPTYWTTNCCLMTVGKQMITGAYWVLSIFKIFPRSFQNGRLVGKIWLKFYLWSMFWKV